MKTIKKDKEIKLTPVEVLRLVLDQVDYIAGNCSATDMVGAVINPDILKIARYIAFKR